MPATNRKGVTATCLPVTLIGGGSLGMSLKLAGF